MAKNTQNTSFRKINVDEMDEYNDPDADEPETPGVGPDEQEVITLLHQNRSVDALKAALKNPPLKTKNQVCHDQRMINSCR